MLHRRKINLLPWTVPCMHNHTFSLKRSKCPHFKNWTSSFIHHHIQVHQSLINKHTPIFQFWTEFSKPQDITTFQKSSETSISWLMLPNNSLSFTESSSSPCSAQVLHFHRHLKPHKISPFQFHPSFIHLPIPSPNTSTPHHQIAPKSISNPSISPSSPPPYRAFAAI